jgi:mannose/fructose/N-acetylgalactosamine-specific phosphotransferase system component IID
MLTGLIHLHSALRWVILILLLVSIVQAFSKNGSLQKTSLFLLIAAHITLLLGIFQYFAGDFGFKIIDRVGGFGNVMKDGFARFWVVEHLSAMLIAIVLITMARGKAKKQNYGAASWMYVIALILILAAVPWPFREAIARPWFPGM